MRKLLIGATCCLLAMVIAPLAQAKKPPGVQVTQAPSITGAVYTTVDQNKDYTGQCKNGNPPVNCNIYGDKRFVFLNGGPTRNSLAPDGVYFFAVLAPGQQGDPNDGGALNLSDDYDCYKNREIVILNGEVNAIQSSTDASCFATGQTPFVHLFDKPYVQLFPYIDTPNHGDEYIMAVCYVGPAGTTTLPAPVTPSLCKYDAFKVQAGTPDTTPPTCKLVLTSAGPPKSITVEVQDFPSGLEDIHYVATNATVTYAGPLVVGSTSPFALTAKKVNAALGSTLVVTVTDVGGNEITCDPVFGGPRGAHTATVGSGARALIGGVGSTQTRLSLKGLAGSARHATVSVNGHRFAVVRILPGKTVRLDLRAALSAKGAKNTVVVTTTGTRGRLYVRISN